MFFSKASTTLNRSLYFRKGLSSSKQRVATVSNASFYIPSYKQ
ncbi:hypothetical protein [Clostridium beijerinckii]|nr:hypothetical protein [Clostridium beijerinckii]NRZ26849.1 hypothetical protein [Clostridium beijerinckii]